MKASSANTRPPRKADETTLKLAALDSLIRLEPETAFTALARPWRRRGIPHPEKKRRVIGPETMPGSPGVLEKTAQSDRDAEVREEAAYWTEQIRLRLIPADLSYYAVPPG